MNAGFIFSLCAGILIGLKIEMRKKPVILSETARRILRDLWYGTGG